MFVRYKYISFQRVPSLSLTSRTTTTSSTTTTTSRNKLLSSLSQFQRQHEHLQPILVAKDVSIFQSQQQPSVNVSLYSATKEAYRFLSSSSYSFDPSATIPRHTSNSDNPQSTMKLDIQLYQYAICPFCNRVKTVLDYIQHNPTSSAGSTSTAQVPMHNPIVVSVQNIEVNPLTKSEIKQYRKEYTKVPIATFTASSSSSSFEDKEKEHGQPPTASDTKTIFGSDEIIRHVLEEYPIIRQQLETRWMRQQQDKHTLLESSASSEQSLASSELLRQPSRMTYDSFVTSEWTNHATQELSVWLYPNMCRTYSESYKAFSYLHDPNMRHQFSTLQRYTIQAIGALAMYLAANKIKSYVCTFMLPSTENKTFAHTHIAYIMFVPIERHNVTDERKALDDVLIKLETELVRLNPPTVAEQSPATNSSAIRVYTFLSGTNVPNLGDLSVYGVLRAIQHLPIYQETIVSRGGPIMEWTQSMSHEIYGNIGTGRAEPNKMNMS
jgi:hypothetical protein